jgi:hypothetical protein
MSQDSPSAYSHSTPRHRAHPSLTTSASGVADSTISFNTYATGITEGSLCLSQFPPPPMMIPSSPTVDRFLPSPARSTFTITAPPRIYPGIDQGQSSPSWSTYTAAPHAQLAYASGSASPNVRTGFMVDQDLPSPALSTFTITSPLSACTAPLLSGADDSSSSRGYGKFERTLNPDLRAGSQSPTSSLMAGKLSPYDWHEGSSIISVDAAEERMLSTSLITELLSSNTPDKSPSPGNGSHHLPPSQVDMRNRKSEMPYPPFYLRHNEPATGSGRFLGEGPDPRINGENDTIGSCSYEEHANMVQSLHGQKVSIVGMAPATLRHIASETSVAESLNPRSQVTYSSTAPLNPRVPSAFPSAMNTMQTTAFQTSIGTPQGWIHDRPMSPGFTSSRPSLKPQRRTSAHSSRTVKSHVSSLISAVGQRTARAARTTLGWLHIKPLPPIPTIPHTSLYQEQEHRRMEGAVPLPQLADRADRLAAMLDSGHFPHDSFIGQSSGFSSDKDSPTRGQMHQGAYSDKSQPHGLHSPRKFKSLLKRPISQSGKIKLFAGASLLALLILIGIVVGVEVGHGHTHSPSCSANRTGNTCSLGELCVALALRMIRLPCNVDSTCICTSSASQCNPVAQSLVSLIPIVNNHFDANFTSETVADAMSFSGASALSDDCAAQARVVDVSPALDSQSVPNRTEWAQGALLWSFVLSQNTSSVGQLRSFISKADWKSLPGDGPVAGRSSKFSTTQLGYVFDFAAQTVSEPSVSFVTDGQPSNAQLAEVDSTAHAALDRMYSFASGACFVEDPCLVAMLIAEHEQHHPPFRQLQ